MSLWNMDADRQAFVSALSPLSAEYKLYPALFFNSAKFIPGFSFPQFLTGLNPDKGGGSNRWAVTIVLPSDIEAAERRTDVLLWPVTLALREVMTITEVTPVSFNSGGQSITTGTSQLALQFVGFREQDSD